MIKTIVATKLQRTIYLSKIKIEKLLRAFFLDTEELIDIQSRIETAFNRGLSGENVEFYYRPLKMVPTHLSLLLDGKEVGRFLAIDLGGTNLRFIEIHVRDGKLKTNSICNKVPNAIMTGTAEELFDYISECIENGLIQVGLAEREIDYLGFTFSFPCNQLALNSGLLIRWTKGYCAVGVEGKDVVLLLREACGKRNLNIKNYVLINDTTGTLLCGAFENKTARIGVINGTGTNACYVENISRIEKWKSPIECNSVIINTEWGSFGENGELADFMTDTDQQLDSESINPGHQQFEKMISGMYLGEIVRLVIIEVACLGFIFKNGIPKFIKEKNSFQTFMLSESYVKKGFLKEFKRQFGYTLDDSEYAAIAKICDIVSKRSATLCAVGLAVTLKRVGLIKTVIAADGSMFKKHPVYLAYVNEFLHLLLPDIEFEIIIIDDGSGKGAALAACVASIHYISRDIVQKNGHTCCSS